MIRTFPQREQTHGWNVCCRLTLPFVAQKKRLCHFTLAGSGGCGLVYTHERTILANLKQYEMWRPNLKFKQFSEYSLKGFFRLPVRCFFFRLPVWNESEAIWNLKAKSEILRANLKPVWNQSKTNLKRALIWNNFRLIIWSNYWNHFRRLTANLKSWDKFDYKNKVRERPTYPILEYLINHIVIF